MLCWRKIVDICRRFICTIVLAVLVLPVAAFAQTAANSGQIIGQVVDGSGGVITGAAVTVRNTETNLTRRTTTDADGRYAVSLLPPGPYEVTAIAAGLEPASQPATVTLGGSTRATLTMRVAGLVEGVEVSAATLEAGAPGKSVLTALQVQNLPASGRRIRTLFQLTPATQIEPECGGFSVSGQKGTMININLDGGDTTNTHWCGHVETTPTVGLEALQEMQVLRGSFSAEFGRSTGGIINMSTRSGTNQFRGSGFYLFRNKDLTTIDPLGREQIDLSQQFGGSFGGPLNQDRTFFFIAPEFQRSTKPVQTLYSSLDSQNVRNSAGAQALLRVAPETEHEALTDSRAFVTRVDHRLSDRHSVMGRFDYVRNHLTNSTGSFNLAQGIGVSSVTNRDLRGQAFINDRKTRTGLLQLTSVLSPRVLNEVRVMAFSESRPSNDTVAGPEVTVRNAGATVAIYGPQATGLSWGNVGYTFNDTRYHLVENVSLVTGAHTAKMGVDVNIVDSRTTFDAGSNGIYTFNSLADYLARKPFQYQQFAGSGTVESQTNQVAFYVQDEWRVGPGLTISPGFRYEMAFTPDYEAPTTPNRFPLATRIPDAMDLVAPRLGLSWDPAENGKTVFRAAGGLFYNAPHVPLYELSIMSNGGNPELSSEVIITTASDPNAVANAFGRFGVDLANAPLENLPVLTIAQVNQLVAPENRIGSTVNFIDPAFRLPRAAHFRVAAERELARGVRASLDYTDINTNRIARVRNINLAPPVPDATGRPIFTNQRPYGPTYGFVNVTESSARSHFQGLTAGVNINRPRYVADAYYTLSWTRSQDDLERPVNSIAYDNAYDLENEYGWANIDQRHQFTATGLVFLPKSFEVSTTLRLNSGRPYSALAGSDLNRDGVQRDRAVINGVVVKRNTYRNTSFSEVNLRVQRGFGITRGARAILSLELFNILNTDNVEVGSANMVYGAGTVVQNGVAVSQDPRADFGQLKDSSGNYLQSSVLRTSPRQAQIGLRFQF
jgi:hypothetical protein